MCETLDIPRSTYYQSLNKTISKRERENNKLTKRILEIHQAISVMVHQKSIVKLVEENYRVSINRVQRLMKKANIRSIIVKKFRPLQSKTAIDEPKNI